MKLIITAIMFGLVFGRDVPKELILPPGLHVHVCNNDCPVPWMEVVDGVEYRWL